MVRKIDAIAILGGGLKKENGKWRTTFFNEKDSFGSLGDRLRVVASSHLYFNLIKNNPRLIIVTLGGRGKTKIKDHPNLSAIIKKELIKLGIPANKIITKSKSDNTYQQLKELNDLILKKNFKSFLLVSNKYHLPRINAFIRKLPSLKKLKKKLLNHQLELASAEKILLKCDPAKWHKLIWQAYKSSFMRKRIVLETKGLKEIKRGLYTL